MSRATDLLIAVFLGGLVVFGLLQLFTEAADDLCAWHEAAGSNSRISHCQEQP